jgi:hypothetical protein
MMRILRSGAIKASYRPQEATKARTQSPTVSTTRSKQYAESDDFVNFLNLTKEGNSVIIVFDRNAVANHYKMFSTSQGTQTVGDEFEEVIVVPKGAMPIQGTMKGFYFNPKRTAEIEEFKDTPWFKELLNSPYYMGQKQSVAEGSQSKDDLIWTLNNFDYYTDNGNVYVNDNGDKIARIGSNWKHQSGKMGSGAEELSAFLSSLQGVAEGFGINYPGTYEQENNMFKGHGQRRIGNLTSENIDPELINVLQYAQQHYPNSKNKQEAFMKFVQRSLGHSKSDDERQDNELERLDKEVNQLQKQVNVTESTDYLEEK